ncbi:hypothetical protein Q4E93_21770 [Flavitalea sp. BT771]|uniref:hypothetical protein n=1 Tax=Flavitalea sp. BT771 TaxID=3063329 RepID=UPI0026E20596|nr:hypothetical protein [Flavitalea sp. BT771]MDO6433254.1 hypothetical protein [Flavitalea sp. BT771]MDV6221470.1 hypothetical protein [Flavitalea sp. BT771]
MTIYMHGENAIDAQLLDISEVATIEEIIVLYKVRFGRTAEVEETFLFVENEERHRRHKDL